MYSVRTVRVHIVLSLFPIAFKNEKRKSNTYMPLFLFHVFKPKPNKKYYGAPKMTFSILFSRKLFRRPNYEFLIRFNELLIRLYELLIRFYEIILRKKVSNMSF